MCIIISKPRDIKLPKDYYENCWNANKDGGGIAYVKDGKLVVDKGYFNFHHFYKEIQKYEDLDMIIHFRVASTGMEISEDMCHPFLLSTKDSDFLTEDGKKKRYEFAIAHNGRLDWKHTGKMSDTACFIEEVMEPHLSRDPFLLDTETGVTLLSRAINYQSNREDGDRVNKFAVLRYDVQLNEVDLYVVNETAGNWEKGCWFSNFSWRKLIPKTQSYLPIYDNEDGLYSVTNVHGKYAAGDFHHPDKDGWLWRHHPDHTWYNIYTKMTIKNLSHKAKPLYMIDLDIKEESAKQSENVRNAEKAKKMKPSKALLNGMTMFSGSERNCIIRASIRWYIDSFSAESITDLDEVMDEIRTDIRNCTDLIMDKEIYAWILKNSADLAGAINDAYNGVLKDKEFAQHQPELTPAVPVAPEVPMTLDLTQGS